MPEHVVNATLKKINAVNDLARMIVLCKKSFKNNNLVTFVKATSEQSKIVGRRYGGIAPKKQKGAGGCRRGRLAKR
jgi:hypothetical protein